MKRKLKYDEEHRHIVLRKKTCLDDSIGSQTEPSDQLDYDPDQLDYDPLHFLRCHSRNNDAADVQTQVWQCAFEPDPNRPHRTTNIVATCGGNSVCFINVKEGTVLGKYYSEDRNEMFYSLAWTTLRTWTNDGMRANILAVGGAKNTIHLIDHNHFVAFLKLTMKTARRVVINSLLFHPTQPSLLFCANSSGDVIIFDIGSPHPPEYNPKLVQLQVLCVKTEIITLAFSIEAGILLAACSEGLCGWKVGNKDLRKQVDNLEFVEFEMPKNPNRAVATKDTKLVDSVEVLGDGYVATKCALSGNIYVWSLKDTLNKVSQEAQQESYPVVPLHVLKWSDTDNYFMYMGYHKTAGILACGDDKGALWLYDIHAVLREPPTAAEDIPPTLVLAWPTLTDTHIDRKRKLSIGVYDIVVDKVVVNCEGEYLVAVTNNNMVCIWERTNPACLRVM